MRQIIAMMVVLGFVILPLSAHAETDGQKIMISENGKAKVKPTQGTLSFSQTLVTMLKKKDGSKYTAAEAKKMLTDEAQNLGKTVRNNLKFAESFTKDFTANVSFSPRYRKNDYNGAIIGYEARASYSITVLDLSKADKLTEAILGSGIEQVSNLYTQVDPKSQRLCEKDALRDAVSKAKERAEVMAALMGGKISRISSARINSHGSPRMFAAKAMAESDSSMYEQRDATCSVSVELVFDVE